MKPLFAAFALAVLAGGATAQAPSDSVPAAPETAAVRARLLEANAPGLRWPRVGDVATAVSAAYERVQWRPLWSNGGRLTPAARRTLAFLAQVDSLGLDPRDFDVSRLDSLARTLDVAPGEATIADFETTLSVANARLLRALRWGRARQPQAYPRVPAPGEGFDLAAGLYALAVGPDPVAVFDQAGPQWSAYRELTRALPAVRRLAADSSLLPGAPVAALRGRPLATAASLRRVLRAIGHAADSAAPSPAADTLLDPSLSRALSAYQKDAGITRSGVFDARTRDHLRASLQRRERDAVLSLERWRWLPRSGDRRAIVVNIPEFRLHVYEQATTGTPTFSMNVVVGRGEKDRYTPLFVEEMEHVIFSPYWEVPQTIAKDEIVPKATKDSTYLVRNRYVLVRGYSDNAPVVKPDTASLARIGKSVRVRQLPGDYNSLGRVKFMLPNDLNIYLHDTNEKHLFKRTARAFSHGCVRVAEPQKLAQWVLAGDTAWSLDRMKKAMKAEKPELVKLSEHIPVLLVYHTAAVDTAGVLRSYSDVYKYNDELATLLAKGYGAN
ncbi:MAG: L,D-transpeptidase family protein [Gemmatimonadetes bacterium]|nr:L,D-transpeptidase family protein [Gemmatimonadota bacterium]